MVCPYDRTGVVHRACATANHHAILSSNNDSASPVVHAAAVTYIYVNTVSIHAYDRTIGIDDSPCPWAGDFHAAGVSNNTPPFVVYSAAIPQSDSVVAVTRNCAGIGHVASCAAGNRHAILTSLNAAPLLDIHAAAGL